MKKWQKLSLIAFTLVVVSLLSMVLGIFVGYRAGVRTVLGPTQVGFIKIVVAAQDIPAETCIIEKMLVTMEVPKTAINQENILNYSEVVGTYAKYDIPKGVPITHAMTVIKP